MSFNIFISFVFKYARAPLTIHKTTKFIGNFCTKFPVQWQSEWAIRRDSTEF